MPARRFPIRTLSLLMALAGLHWLVADKTLLYFSASDITRGEIWRIVSGHFMHADSEHLLWNGAGLAVLGSLVEHRSPTMLWAALGAGIVSVSTLLLTPFSELGYYCGLSGVLNSLLLVALWLEWRVSRSRLLLVIAVCSVVKVVIEIRLGASILTHISWPPYAWSHLAGLTGGLVVVWTREIIGYLSLCWPTLRYGRCSVTKQSISGRSNPGLFS